MITGKLLDDGREIEFLKRRHNGVDGTDCYSARSPLSKQIYAETTQLGNRQGQKKRKVCQVQGLQWPASCWLLVYYKIKKWTKNA